MSLQNSKPDDIQNGVQLEHTGENVGQQQQTSTVASSTLSREDELASTPHVSRSNSSGGGYKSNEDRLRASSEVGDRRVESEKSHRAPDDSPSNTSPTLLRHDGGVAAVAIEGSTMKSRRLRKHLHRLPFRHEPLRVTSAEGAVSGRDNEIVPWLHDDERATEWVDLFFDLVVVAVLSIFSLTHEIRTPAEIPTFFSYYLILIWIWTTQVHYDLRYEAEDTFHLVMKGTQIMVFVYIGAASGGWDPSKILDPDYLINPGPGDEVAHAQGERSFLTVASAFAVNRAILALQYGFVIYTGRRAGRRIDGPILMFCSLVASCILSVVATAIPAQNQTLAYVSLGLFYFAIAVEIVFNLYYLATHRDKHGGSVIFPEDLAERYAALSLIILGEGFSSLTRVTSNAITGLDEASALYYVQVFLIIVVIFNIWSFLFANFRKGDVTDTSSAWIALWELIHFPLHFSILLLLAAMMNTIQITSFANSLTSVTEYWQDAAEGLFNGTQLSRKELMSTAIYLDRLDVLPTFQTQYRELVVYAGQATPTQDPYVISVKYLGQLMRAVCGLSGINIGSRPLGNLDLLVSLNTTDTTSATLLSEAINLVDIVVKDILNDALTGVLWLFPAAGGTLFLCALRSMTRYRFNGPAHHILHGLQFAFGIALGILGFLAIGSRDIWVTDSIAHTHIVPMYTLLDQEWAIAVVAIVYSFLNVGSMVLLWIIHKKRGGVFEKVSTTRGTA